MRALKFAVLSVMAQFSLAFTPSLGPRRYASVSRAGGFDHGRHSQLGMALEDLEAKLLGDEPKKVPKKALKPDKPPAPKKAVPNKKETKEEESLKSLLSSPEVAPLKVPKPVPAPAPKPSTQKAKYEVSTPFEKKAPRAVVPKAAPRITKPPKQTKPVKQTKPAGGLALPKVKLSPPNVKTPRLSPPKVKVPVASDPNAKALGVALGGAPLLIAPIVALSAGRSLLTKTAARREQIQNEIAQAKAAREKRRIEAETDAGALAKAVAFLGAGGAALALIVANPFANVQAPDLPFSAKSGTTVVAPAPQKKQTKDPSGYKLDAVEKAQKKAKAAKEESTKDAKEAKAAAKAAAAKEAEAAKAEKEAAKAEAAAAKAKGKEEVAAAAAKVNAEKQAAAKAEKEAAVAKKEAERESAKAEDAAAKAKADKEAVTKAEAEKKAADEAKAKAETEAKNKAAAEAVETKKAASSPAPAPAPATKSDLVAQPPKTNPAVIKDANAGGIGVVVGSEGGGRVLPKEELSSETLDFLKNYKK